MLQSFNNEKSSNIALQQNSSGKKFRYLLHLFEILRNFKYLKSWCEINVPEFNIQ